MNFGWLLANPSRFICHHQAITDTWYESIKYTSDARALPCRPSPIRWPHNWLFAYFRLQAIAESERREIRRRAKQSDRPAKWWAETIKSRDVNWRNALSHTTKTAQTHSKLLQNMNENQLRQLHCRCADYILIYVCVHLSLGCEWFILFLFYIEHKFIAYIMHNVCEWCYIEPLEIATIHFVLHNSQRPNPCKCAMQMCSCAEIRRCMHLDGEWNGRFWHRWLTILSWQEAIISGECYLYIAEHELTMPTISIFRRKKIYPQSGAIF